MRDEIFTCESFINWCGDLIGMGNLEDHKGSGALHPQFRRAKTAVIPAVFVLYFLGNEFNKFYAHASKNFSICIKIHGIIYGSLCSPAV